MCVRCARPPCHRRHAKPSTPGPGARIISDQGHGAVRALSSGEWASGSHGRVRPMRQVVEARSTSASRHLPPIAVAGVLLLCAIAAATGQGREVKVIEMEIGDNMRFKPSVVDAEPGQPLRVVLKPVGKIKALGHNFVLLKEGIEPKPFVDKAADATEKTGAIPPAMTEQVIAAIPLVRTGSTGEVSFESPAQRGEYDFVCTFPGHFKLGMKGHLIVK